MPRAGAVTLSDVLEPGLTIVCEPCNRRGSYGVRRLLGKHGNARLPDLLSLLSADCSKRTANRITDTCKARFAWPDGPPTARER
jgi:hypothetical protein